MACKITLIIISSLSLNTAQLRPDSPPVQKSVVNETISISTTEQTSSATSNESWTFLIIIISVAVILIALAILVLIKLRIFQQNTKEETVSNNSVSEVATQKTEQNNTNTEMIAKRGTMQRQKESADKLHKIWNSYLPSKVSVNEDMQKKNIDKVTEIEGIQIEIKHTQNIVNTNDLNIDALIEEHDYAHNTDSDENVITDMIIQQTITPMGPPDSNQ
eukprot:1010147_1